jgi:hypothetical protein
MTKGQTVYFEFGGIEVKGKIIEIFNDLIKVQWKDKKVICTAYKKPEEIRFIK